MFLRFPPGNQYARFFLEGFHFAHPTGRITRQRPIVNAENKTVSYRNITREIGNFFSKR
jgi:hypothetical protein